MSSLEKSKFKCILNPLGNLQTNTTAIQSYQSFIFTLCGNKWKIIQVQVNVIENHRAYAL